MVDDGLLGLHVTRKETMVNDDELIEGLATVIAKKRVIMCNGNND